MASKDMAKKDNGIIVANKADLESLGYQKLPPVHDRGPKIVSRIMMFPVFPSFSGYTSYLISEDITMATFSFMLIGTMGLAFRYLSEFENNAAIIRSHKLQLKNEDEKKKLTWDILKRRNVNIEITNSNKKLHSYKGNLYIATYQTEEERLHVALDTWRRNFQDTLKVYGLDELKENLQKEKTAKLTAAYGSINLNYETDNDETNDKLRELIIVTQRVGFLNDEKVAYLKRVPGLELHYRQMGQDLKKFKEDSNEKLSAVDDQIWEAMDKAVILYHEVLDMATVKNLPLVQKTPSWKRFFRW